MSEIGLNLAVTVARQSVCHVFHNLVLFLFLYSVMPIPGEGIESTYKNSVDDVQIFLDTKHASKFAVVNLSQRPSKLKGKVITCGTTVVLGGVEGILFCEFHSILPVAIYILFLLYCCRCLTVTGLLKEHHRWRRYF